MDGDFGGGEEGTGTGEGGGEQGLPRRAACRFGKDAM